MRLLIDRIAEAALPGALLQSCVDRIQSDWASMHNALLAPEKAAQEAREAFQQITGGRDRIAVQRVVLAPLDWDWENEDRDHLYWSWTAEGAKAYWGDHTDGMTDWRLYATSDLDQVDWPATIAANVTRPEETEVRIKPGMVLHDLEADHDL